jgi:hypothetical protein
MHDCLHALDISSIHSTKFPDFASTIGNVKCKGKGKAIPLQAWADPEGSRKLRLPDFKTMGTGSW